MSRAGFKHLRRRFYRFLPSWSVRWHDKRRKGLQGLFTLPDFLECQVEQDHVFWQSLLHPEGGGWFWEIGGGDGSTGSQTLGLELWHGWKGFLWEENPQAMRRAQAVRGCGVLSGQGPSESAGFPTLPDLLAVHRPHEMPGIWDHVQRGLVRPRWIVVENPRPDPCWVRRLSPMGYRLRWFCHDDEYFELGS